MLQDVHHGGFRVHGACDISAMCGKFNGNALCMVCNVWNITQVEAKCCRMSTMVALECMVLVTSRQCVVSSMVMLCAWCAMFGISHRLKPSVAGCPPWWL